MLKLERHYYKLKNKTKVPIIKAPLLHNIVVECFVNNKIIAWKERYNMWMKRKRHNFYIFVAENIKK